MPRTIRKPSHAGSWYEHKAHLLSSQLDAWLEAANIVDQIHPRAIIVPHAGYSYCGHVMPYGYKHIDPSQVRRVFLLGPSHHVHTRKCVLSSAASYETPLGSLTIDEGVYEELRATGQFDSMDQDVDEAEHSLELHTPYIVKIMGSQSFTLIPIMVGSLSIESEASYGALLAKYFDDPANLFVISSDFCHWGRRFSYTFYDKSQGPIWKSIEWLDRQSMDAIETGDPAAFATHLQLYRNTICGRHPIGVLLNILNQTKGNFDVRFHFYEQSSRANNMSDSSVSYAAATVVAS